MNDTFSMFTEKFNAPESLKKSVSKIYIGNILKGN